MSQPIAVVAIVDAKPEFVAKTESEIKTCVKFTRQEAGCLLYTCHKDLNVPGRFVFVEQWVSLEALAAHEKTPHFLALAEALKPMLSAPLQISVLQELDA